jgi:hypothetical protein
MTWGMTPQCVRSERGSRTASALVQRGARCSHTTSRPIHVQARQVAGHMLQMLGVLLQRSGADHLAQSHTVTSPGGPVLKRTTRQKRHLAQRGVELLVLRRLDLLRVAQPDRLVAVEELPVEHRLEVLRLGLFCLLLVVVGDAVVGLVLFRLFLCMTMATVGLCEQPTACSTCRARRNGTWPAVAASSVCIGAETLTFAQCCSVRSRVEGSTDADARRRRAPGSSASFSTSLLVSR